MADTTYVDYNTPAVNAEWLNDTNSVVYKSNSNIAGAVNRTALDKFIDLVSVKDFGAVGDGSTDDTTALQSALNSGIKSIYVPEGIYLVSSPLTINSSYISIFGEGVNNGSKFITTNDIDIFRVDIGTGYKYFNQFHDLSFQYVGTGSQTSGSAIRYYDSTGLQAGGGTHGQFKNLTINGFYHGIVFDKAKLAAWGAYTQIAEYGQFLFDTIRIPYSAKTQAFGILFKGGPGAHNTFVNSFLQNTVACIRIGDGTTDGGLGDQLFLGCHLLDAKYAIDLIGPSGAGRYNQNITITGCHFDGITVATVNLSNMSNFRIGPNNSTATVGIAMATCSNYFVEDRNTFSFPNSVFLGSINTTAAAITDSNGTRYTQSIMARRNVNTDYLKIVGGNVNGAGAGLELYGGAHATLPNHAFVFANRMYIRDQAGAITMFDADYANGTVGIGNGAWNGYRLKLGTYQLWVDASGRLRIKSGSPTSDTDGTVVGTQV